MTGQARSQKDRRPWNRGKLCGTKPLLRPKHVWAIRTRLEMAGRTRDLALFNLAIDSEARGCDLVRLRVSDIAPFSYTLERATVRQRKTGQPVKFEITEQTRQAVDDYLRVAKPSANYLFSGRGQGERHLSTRQYAPLLSQWPEMIWLDPALFGTHSLRRTKATSSTGKPATFELSNCSLVTGRLKAPCDTWVLM